MKTISLDLRERILAAYDRGEATREQVGKRFAVSTAMVKKLLQQRRRIGEIGPLHYRSGRKARIVAGHRQKLGRLLVEKPDRTLAELRSALGLECSLPAIHYVLASMGLTYKKRRCAPVSKIVAMWQKRGADGSGPRRAGSRASWSSWMSRRPKPT